MLTAQKLFNSNEILLEKKTIFLNSMRNNRSVLFNTWDWCRQHAGPKFKDTFEGLSQEALQALNENPNLEQVTLKGTIRPHVLNGLLQLFQTKPTIISFVMDAVPIFRDKEILNSLSNELQNNSLKEIKLQNLTSDISDSEEASLLWYELVCNVLTNCKNLEQFTINDARLLPINSENTELDSKINAAFAATKLKVFSLGNTDLSNLGQKEDSRTWSMLCNAISGCKDLEELILDRCFYREIDAISEGMWEEFKKAIVKCTKLDKISFQGNRISIFCTDSKRIAFIDAICEWGDVKKDRTIDIRTMTKGELQGEEPGELSDIQQHCVVLGFEAPKVKMASRLSNS